MFSKFFSSKKMLWLAVVGILAVSGYYVFQTFMVDLDVADAPEMQTAKVRQGDLTLYASGTGTLIPAAEASFGFRSSGQLLSLSFSVGDVVEAGQLLAELDNTAEQIEMAQAERVMTEVMSPAAIAAAEQELALAENDVIDKRNTLAYQIGPTVYNWEKSVTQYQDELLVARSEAADNPSDEADAKVADLESKLDYAEKSLISAWYSYEEYYLPETFTILQLVEGTRNQYEESIAGPSEADINIARADYAAAQVQVIETQYYLAALNGEEIPSDATGSMLATLENAQLGLLSAQDHIDATRLYAPISGIVMSIDANLGDTLGTSAIMTIADTSEAYLEIFLDETDWGMIDVGYPVDVNFDLLLEKTFVGEVVQVDPALYTEQGTSVVRALVRLDDASFDGIKLPVGSAAAIEVIGGRAEEAILVPVEALREASPGQYTVFVMVDGEPKLRVVEVGLQDLFYAEVLSGLEIGDMVTTGVVETKDVVEKTKETK